MLHLRDAQGEYNWQKSHNSEHCLGLHIPDFYCHFLLPLYPRVGTFQHCPLRITHLSFQVCVLKTFFFLLCVPQPCAKHSHVGNRAVPPGLGVAGSCCYGTTIQIPGSRFKTASTPGLLLWQRPGHGMVPQPPALRGAGWVPSLYV